MQVIIFMKKEMSVKFLAALLWPAMLLPILSHADSGIQTVSVSQAYADDATGCEQLYPVESFESLFRQMAGTLRSACLLNMPPEDLAQKWQIPVYRRYLRLSGRVRPDGEKQAVLRWKDKAERQKWLKHRRRKLKRPTDGFTVVHQTNYNGSTFLEIEATPDYLKHYRSLFPDNRYPEDLPLPSIGWHPMFRPIFCSDSAVSFGKSLKDIDNLEKSLEAIDNNGHIKNFHARLSIHDSVSLYFMHDNQENMRCSKEISYIQYKKNHLYKKNYFITN
jgi:hypothetical protein